MSAPANCEQCNGTGVSVRFCDAEEANPIGALDQHGVWKPKHELVPVVSAEARKRFGDYVKGMPWVTRSSGVTGNPIRIELCDCVRKALRKYL